MYVRSSCNFCSNLFRLKWFDTRKSYLDSLEIQLRAMVKAIEVVTKQRAGKNYL